jgi:ring-1,2-phenylacetyl-CoA epoxidase subunit PaaD
MVEPKIGAQPAAGGALAALEARVWLALASVEDPEIPVISVLDLGIVRGVRCEGDLCHVTITPTYSGCPAMTVIREEIHAALAALGLRAVVETQLAPAWTTDWISEQGRKNLKGFGIAAPRAVQINVSQIGSARHEPPVACPRCASLHTRLISRFGSTACKALHRCDDCLEPFDEFKSH